MLKEKKSASPDDHKNLQPSINIDKSTWNVVLGPSGRFELKRALTSSFPILMFTIITRSSLIFSRTEENGACICSWSLLTRTLPRSRFASFSNPPSESEGKNIMATRGHVFTLTQRTWERRRAYRCVGRGKCRSMKMRVLKTERTRFPYLKLETKVQLRWS